MASSVRREEVVWGVRCWGIRERRLVVWDEGDDVRLGRERDGVWGVGMRFICGARRVECWRLWLGGRWDRGGPWVMLEVRLLRPWGSGRRRGGGKSSSSAGLRQQNIEGTTFDFGLPFSFRCLSGRGREGSMSSGTDIKGPCTSCHCSGSVSLREGRFSCSFLRLCLLSLVGVASLSRSSTPSLSTRVSMLVLSFSCTTSVALLLAATRFSAWSLCCQQKNAAALPPSMSSSVRTARTPRLGAWEAPGEDASPRRQSRPFEVRPLQVVAGFLESDRERRDSGVCGMRGI